MLGGKLSEFLCNLDALHDHLGSIYPGMRAPSFRVTTRNGAIILHYYSVRDGLEHIVLGIVKTVARKLLNTEVSKDRSPNTVRPAQGEQVAHFDES